MDNIRYLSLELKLISMGYKNLPLSSLKKMSTKQLTKRYKRLASEATKSARKKDRGTKAGQARTTRLVRGSSDALDVLAKRLSKK